MNQHRHRQNERIAARSEDIALDRYLADRDFEVCSVCLMDRATTGHDEVDMCQSCYDSACEEEEMKAELKEEEL